ncbi:MAG: hypothetical protein M3Y71_04085 [Actinomycetota bacterium]|nr:hypothetical protein [Actinomycetota bacterium]
MTAYRLGVGDRAPAQHSATTCGAASLTVARLLADPGFAGWMQTGVSAGSAGRAFLPNLATPDERFAAAEELTIRRTNHLVGPGRRLQLPWPRGLGTPPWGARHELEHGAATPGTRYVVRWCRPGGVSARRRLLERVGRAVTPGRPAALYVGSSLLPRHVTLVVAGADGGPVLYDPSAGVVLALDPDALSAARLGVAGWPVPWCAVLPVTDP